MPVLDLVDARNLLEGRLGVNWEGEGGYPDQGRWVLRWTGHLAGIRKVLGLIRDQRGIGRKQVALGMTDGEGALGAGGDVVNPRIRGASARNPVR